MFLNSDSVFLNVNLKIANLFIENFSFAIREVYINEDYSLYSFSDFPGSESVSKNVGRGMIAYAWEGDQIFNATEYIERENGLKINFIKENHTVIIKQGDIFYIDLHFRKPNKLVYHSSGPKIEYIVSPKLEYDFKGPPIHINIKSTLFIKIDKPILMPDGNYDLVNDIISLQLFDKNFTSYQ